MVLIFQNFIKRFAGLLSISFIATFFGLYSCTRRGAVRSKTMIKDFYQQKPNIVWIIAEDICPDLGCYGASLIQTPNIDKLASEGVRFTNAFVTGPVCSTSRSALITGMYQTTIGAHNHRSHRGAYGLYPSKLDGPDTLPKGIKLITDYFRKAGYFTANVTTPAPGVRGSGKTDFNFIITKPFDGTDWNQRKPGQPFFAEISLGISHRAFDNGVKFCKEHNIPLVDPDKVNLPPYYPDDPVAREDWAFYLDCIQAVDCQVGAILKRIKEENLVDNTIILFIGDHGRCMVRGKQWLYDGGIHIPLIVRWPGRIKPGSVRDDLVSGIDISATLLRLAGITLPEYMEGQVFLGPSRKEREYIIAARDRCDETVDRIRCVRTKYYKYIRNFMPERPYTQWNWYKEGMYPVLTLMKQLHAKGKLTPEQEIFMAFRKPEEELYDLLADPYEVHNLAKLPEFRGILKELRSILNQWISKTGDKGAILQDPKISEYIKRREEKDYSRRKQKILGLLKNKK